SQRNPTVNRAGELGHGRRGSFRSIAIVSRSRRPTAGAFLGRNDRRSPRPFNPPIRPARPHLPRHRHRVNSPRLQLHRRRPSRIPRPPPTHALSTSNNRQFDTFLPQGYHPPDFTVHFSFVRSALTIDGRS